jgi:hypothetical protein
MPNPLRFGKIDRITFIPRIFTGKWYITKLENITLHGNKEWEDPSCSLSLHAHVTVSTIKKSGGWMEPDSEEYDDVWFDIDRDEIVNMSKPSGPKQFGYQCNMHVMNAKEVLDKIREKMNEGPKEEQ